MAKRANSNSWAFGVKTRGYDGIRKASEGHIAMQMADKISNAEGCEDKEYLVIYDPQSVYASGKIDRLEKFVNPDEHRVWYMASFKGGKITHNPSPEYIEGFLDDCKNETAKADKADDKPAKDTASKGKGKKKLAKANGISATEVSQMIAANNATLIEELKNAFGK